MDHFLRVEFQHRGSPYVHVLLWLLNDPKEVITKDMPQTIALIEELCSVDLRSVEDQAYASLQVYKHTFTYVTNTTKRTGVMVFVVSTFHFGHRNQRGFYYHLQELTGDVTHGKKNP